MSKTELEAAVNLIWWRCTTYRTLYAAAGIPATDEAINEFWKGKDEDAARAALKDLIRDRVNDGTLDARNYR